ncbi:Laminin-like protein [Wickerhamomyces ciferrii]|uniref:Laminin-like protein n=1 Tax=Wickerhamomyces ciferrii (strain ATCC 14091 / BCRC 22168 / CBS 111 / JCM 3599 / NBRC 0793 / NRRL Y-1031 F-60-10) TaxID=1206466 RepID=K0KGB0_WICCF|nr:Laminin-like protein [Wickerhamomyces ciferrii]CCH40469.1 Laminin-like protein [Wickerhamomyces ciferrii]
MAKKKNNKSKDQSKDQSKKVENPPVEDKTVTETQKGEETSEPIVEDKKESIEETTKSHPKEAIEGGNENNIDTDPVKSSIPPVDHESNTKEEHQDDVKDNTDLAKDTKHAETITKEPSSEPAPETQVPKKRLTLQERLALAAKSKGKPKRNTSASSTTHSETSQTKTNVASETSTRENSIEPQEEIKNPEISSPKPSTLPSTREPSLDIQRSDPIPPTTISSSSSLFPKTFKELPIEELHKLISDAEIKFSSLESKNESLTTEKQSLQEKVKNLNSNLTSQQSSSVSSQLIKDKDDKIAQLLKEGENLSMKELKYTNTIKKLKSNESQNEKEIKNLNSKNQSLEIEKKNLKEDLKKLTNSEQNLNNQKKTLQIQLDNEKESLKDEIKRNKELSSKIEELSQVLIQEKNHASNTINELKRSLEKEKNKLKTIQQDNISEINRLETKIEQLRFQNENAQASTGTEDEGYLKLIRQHDTLQNQYTSATENWQSIEASLGNRISSLQNDLNSVKTQLNDSEEQNKVLINDLELKSQKIEILQNDLKKLNSELSLIKTKNETLNKENKNLISTLETKELNFNKEKAALDYKIQGLEKQFKDSIQPQHLSVPSSNNINTLDFSSPHTGSTPSFKRGNSWEIGLGESSTTPRQSRKSSALSIPQYNQNNSSFDESAENISDFDDNDTINSPISAYNNGNSRFENNSSSAINGGSSVQLLGKLSSQIRRLQIESSTKDEELEKLSKDMKDANEEIVKLMKDNENVENYRIKIKELEESVESITQRHEKALEILGEKSEQVEELKADIQDWKDLCRQQVQQLADKA